MKLFTLSIICIVLGVFNCSSSKSQQNNPPFKVDAASYVYWIAGVKGGGSGIDFQVKLKNPLNEEVSLDSLYFKNMGAKLEFHQTEKFYTAHLISHQNTNEDLILSSDLNEESKNKLPLNEIKSPIALNNNDALLTYFENGKKHYFKIEAIVERESSNFPHSPKNH